MSANNSTGRCRYFYDPAVDVCYCRLDSLGWPHYCVGDDGTVWSKRIRRSKNKRSRVWLPIQPVQLRDGSKRVIVSLIDANNKTRLHYISKLILLAFVGPRPGSRYEFDGCHNDGNPINNNLANLRWATRKENHADAVRHGRKGSGERSSNHKYTPEIIRAIRADAAADSSYGYKVRLSAKYGIPKSTIKKIVFRLTWPDV